MKVLVMMLIITSFTFSCVTFAEDPIQVGYYDDYPLSFQNDSGEPSGFFIDLLKDFSKNSDYRVDFNYNYWSKNLEGLADGSIDVLVDIVYTSDRDEIYDFSKEPVILNWGKVAAANHLTIESVLDLEGLTIGHLPNDYYFISEEGLKNQVEAFKLDVTFRTYESYSEILEAIDQGIIDAGVLNRFAIHEVYDYSAIREVPINFSANNLLLATNEGENQEFLQGFDDYIENLKADRNSYYYERYNFWVNQVRRGPFQVFFERNRTYIVSAVLALLLTMAFSRYKTTKKVKEIKATNERLETINAAIKEDHALIETLTEEMDQATIDSEKTIQKFRRIIAFLANAMAVQEAEDTTDFLMKLFKEAYELIDTLDYACLFFYNGGEASYVSDFEGLTKKPLDGIRLKNLFKNKEQVKTRKKLQLPIDETIGFKEKQVLKNLNNRIKDNPYSAVISIRYEGELLAAMVLSRSCEKSFTPGEERILLALGNIGASYYLNEAFRETALKFQREIVYSLVEMLEIHDEYTKGHSEVVANLSRKFAEYLGLAEDVVEDIYWAGLLHDIGKILVDQSVLQKKGKLTLAEEEMIKKHSIYGYQALNQSKITNRIAEYVLYHHERYDGEGYPHGLKGEEIPLGSRIIALADSYEAIGSSRSYKKGLNKEKVIKEIKDNLGRRYDPIIGEVFIEMVQG